MKTKSAYPAVVLLALVATSGRAARAQDCAPNTFCGAMMSAATSGSPTNGSSDAEVRTGTGWELAPVVTGPFIVGLLLGDARGDGTTRLYATQVTANTVKEFTFDEDWANTSNISLPFYSEGALLLGDGRGKGSAHLYVGEFNFGGNVSEFTFDGASWTSIPMDPARQQLLGAADGDPHGDGIPHVYFSTGSAPPNNLAYEYTFNGATWGLAPIASPFPGLGSFGIAVADGRNDTVQRIYEGALDTSAGNWHAYELSWNGADWDASRVATMSGGGSLQVMGVAVGDPRNEGINRVYVLVRGSGVREFTFDGEAWAQTDDISIGPELFGIAIGDGQNDGTNRLYIAEYSPSRVVEATFDGAAWQTAEVATLSGNAFRVRVGDGRGDSVNRVYASTSAGVYELTHP